jgi:acetylornithine/succinyldiaminopimelate/putrescine aminotransferase
MTDRATVARASGPEALLRLKTDYLVPCTYHFYRRPPQIVAGRGNVLVDHEGREYLDCVSGVGVMSAGHANEAIIAPAIDQIRTLQHTTTIYLTEPVLRLAERLAQIAPGGLRRSFFCASGSEAVEGALMLATMHAQRPGIVAFTGALHGRTRWAMSATGLDMWRSDPFPPEVHRARFGDAADLRRIAEAHGPRIAAVIGEPIQGNGGIVVPPEGFWPEVRAICDEHGIMLVLDEVQTGFGRTGRWFACEHEGVVPDLLAVSKALGNGFPIAAFVTTDAIAASGTRPAASTYGGNPVCAAAALATIDFHAAHDLAGNARARGRQIVAGVEAMRKPRELANLRVRGRGLMLGMPVASAGGRTGAERCDALLEALLDRGVLAGKAGPGRDVLTLMPSLTITAVEVDRLLAALEDALGAACGERPAAALAGGTKC